MKKDLAQRLKEARTVLDSVHQALLRNSGSVHSETEQGFRLLVDARVDIDHLLNLLETRNVAKQWLDGLENNVNANGLVVLGPWTANYQHVRFIGVQAYVSTKWALADRIAGMVALVLCTPEAHLDVKNPAQLVSHFVRSNRKKKTAATLGESVRKGFGWPIALSYAIRNHFVHDGAQFGGIDFFEGTTAATGFKVSASGWEAVVKDAEGSNVSKTDHRVGQAWPAAPRDDLRVLLSVCEREMDDALGILLASACASLASHVGFMLDEG